MELSNKTQKIIATTCGVVLLGILLVLALRNFDFAPTTQVNQAQQTAETPAPTTGDEDEAAVAPAEPAPTPAATTSAQDYTYTAVAGDSYTLLARSAVQQYATAHNLQLSNDQTLLAEATLASNAGSPLLDIGQQITIKQSDIAAVLGVSEQAQSATTKTSDNSTNTSDKSADTSAKSDGAASVSYTAAAGDSYTTLARTAISSYASKNKLSLTSAQRVAAESSLVAAAGAPQLAIGQVVTFATSDIKSAVAAATQLPAADLAVWQQYAQLAGL